WAHPQLAQDEEPGGAGGKTRGRRGLGGETLEMTTRTHFSFRVDTWTSDGESIVEHVAGVEDYQVALATFRTACEALARHADAGRTRDRGQPASTSGVDRQRPAGQALSLAPPSAAEIRKPVFNRTLSAIFWVAMLHTKPTP